MRNINKKHVIKPIHIFTNVRELVEYSAQEYKDKYAYSYRLDPHSKEATKVTFPEFASHVRALAAKLNGMGMSGKHIALIGKLSYEWSLMYFAAFSINAVLIPLDRDWDAETLAQTVIKAKTDFLFGDEDIADKLDYVKEHANLSCETVYLLSSNRRPTVTELVGEGKSVFLLHPELYYDVPINTRKMSLLVFTSGTTGKGKGVMLSQEAILANMYNAIHYISYGDVTVAVLPPHHTFGSTIMLTGHIMIGSEVYISSGIRYITKELSEVRPEHLILVPLYLETFYRKILANLKEKGKYDLVFKMIKVSNALRKIGIDIRAKVFKEIHKAFGGRVGMIISGGAPLAKEIIYFYDGIGITILNGYGITECSPLISVNRARHNVYGSVGDPIDGVDVVIDEPNEDGEGEILVKGTSVMLGYYKDDEATADAFKNGYFRTGDYGKLGRDGVLYITGRKKNLIILSNGKNVYPEEIENALVATPGIADIIVYEGQSKRGITYNSIVAEIYPDEEYFKKNGITDLEAYFKPYIDGFNKTAVPYKKIGVLKIRNEPFPKNTLRKIQRFKLDMTIE